MLKWKRGMERRRINSGRQVFSPYLLQNEWYPFLESGFILAGGGRIKATELMLKCLVSPVGFLYYLAVPIFIRFLEVLVALQMPELAGNSPLSSLTQGVRRGSVVRDRLEEMLHS